MVGPSPKLVLSSASKRRLELLSQVQIFPDEVFAPKIDETPQANETARQLVTRLSVLKAGQGVKKFPGSFVIGADTVIAVGGRVLGKAKNKEEEREYLAKLSGRRHRAISGIAIFNPEGESRTKVVETKVTFKMLNKLEIESYLEMDEWRDASGGYAIQGYAACFVRQINGTYHNVVGLPLLEVVNLLQGMGYRKMGAKT